MTSNPGMNLNSVLPLNARTTRIAAGGALIAYAHEFPSDGNAAAFGQVSNGANPDVPVRRADEAPRIRLRPFPPIQAESQRNHSP